MFGDYLSAARLGRHWRAVVLFLPWWISASFGSHQPWTNYVESPGLSSNLPICAYVCTCLHCRVYRWSVVYTFACVGGSLPNSFCRLQWWKNSFQGFSRDKKTSRMLAVLTGDSKPWSALPLGRGKVLAFIKVCIDCINICICLMLLVSLEQVCLCTWTTQRIWDFYNKWDTLFYWYGCGLFGEAVGGIRVISAHQDNRNKRFSGLVAFL